MLNAAINLDKIPIGNNTNLNLANFGTNSSSNSSSNSTNLMYFSSIHSQPFSFKKISSQIHHLPLSPPNDLLAAYSPSELVNDLIEEPMLWSSSVVTPNIIPNKDQNNNFNSFGGNSNTNNYGNITPAANILNLNYKTKNKKSTKSTLNLISVSPPPQSEKASSILPTLAAATTLIKAKLNLNQDISQQVVFQRLDSIFDSTRAISDRNINPWIHTYHPIHTFSTVLRTNKLLSIKVQRILLQSLQTLTKLGVNFPLSVIHPAFIMTPIPEHIIQRNTTPVGPLRAQKDSRNSYFNNNLPPPHSTRNGHENITLPHCIDPNLHFNSIYHSSHSALSYLDSYQSSLFSDQESSSMHGSMHGSIHGSIHGDRDTQHNIPLAPNDLLHTKYISSLSNQRLLTIHSNWIYNTNDSISYDNEVGEGGGVDGEEFEFIPDLDFLEEQALNTQLSYELLLSPLLTSHGWLFACDLNNEEEFNQFYSMLTVFLPFFLSLLLPHDSEEFVHVDNEGDEVWGSPVSLLGQGGGGSLPDESDEDLNNDGKNNKKKGNDKNNEIEPNLPPFDCFETQPQLYEQLKFLFSRHVKKIPLDKQYWKQNLLPKLRLLFFQSRETTPQNYDKNYDKRFGSNFSTPQHHPNTVFQPTTLTFPSLDDYHPSMSPNYKFPIGNVSSRTTPSSTPLTRSINTNEIQWESNGSEFGLQLDQNGPNNFLHNFSYFGQSEQNEQNDAEFSEEGESIFHNDNFLKNPVNPTAEFSSNSNNTGINHDDGLGGDDGQNSVKNDEKNKNIKKSDTKYDSPAPVSLSITSFYDIDNSHVDGIRQLFKEEKVIIHHDEEYIEENEKEIEKDKNDEKDAKDIKMDQEVSVGQSSDSDMVKIDESTKSLGDYSLLTSLLSLKEIEMSNHEKKQNKLTQEEKISSLKFEDENIAEILEEKIISISENNLDDNRITLQNHNSEIFSQTSSPSNLALRQENDKENNEFDQNGSSIATITSIETPLPMTHYKPPSDVIVIENMTKNEEIILERKIQIQLAINKLSSFFRDRLTIEQCDLYTDVLPSHSSYPTPTHTPGLRSSGSFHTQSHTPQQSSSLLSPFPTHQIPSTRQTSLTSHSNPSTSTTQTWLYDNYKAARPGTGNCAELEIAAIHTIFSKMHLENALLVDLDPKINPYGPIGSRVDVNLKNAKDEDEKKGKKGDWDGKGDEKKNKSGKSGNNGSNGKNGKNGKNGNNKDKIDNDAAAAAAVLALQSTQLPSKKNRVSVNSNISQVDPYEYTEPVKMNQNDQLSEEEHFGGKFEKNQDNNSTTSDNFIAPKGPMTKTEQIHQEFLRKQALKNQEKFKSQQKGGKKVHDDKKDCNIM